jgi:beta-xylosidase
VRGHGSWSGAALACLIGGAALAQTPPWNLDRPDGRYVNPILPGDYSDPDAVRVGDTYYLTSSSFANTPGLPILKSTDLVHWTLIGHALTEVPPKAHFATPRRGGGVWAPAIRHHDGRFWIYYPDPDFGIFVTTAADPAGPWTEPVLVDDSKGAIDPCPFWDDDGAGWLVMGWAKSRSGVNNVVTLKRLSADGRGTVGAPINIIEADKMPPVATSNGVMPWMTTEGPKLYKRNGWYYVFAPSGSVKGGWQGVFRSRAVTGPYEGRNVLDQGKTDINGPHQGAWVTTPTGEDWFLHFQDADSYGRQVWLEPMSWSKDWPVIGVDKDGDGRGEPVRLWRAPKAAGGPVAPTVTGDDEFDGPPSLAWQWNANAAEDWSSSSAAPGSLRLKSISSPANLWEAGAVLTQKLPGDRFVATARLSFQPKSVGERSGLVMLGSDYAFIGLEKTEKGVRLVRAERLGADRGQAETILVGLEEAPASLVLRLSAEPVVLPEPPPGFTPYWPSMLRSRHAKVSFSYSLDGKTFVSVGEPFVSRPGRWVGAQVGLFAQAPAGTPANTATRIGWTDVDWFRFSDVGLDAPVQKR